MATSVATPPATPAAQPAQEAVTYDRVDYVVGTNKQGEAEVVNANAKNLEERIKNGDFQEAFRQTVAFPVATGIAGIKQIATGEDIVVRCFNAGSKQKALTRVLNELKEQDEEKKFVFTPVDGAYDTTELINAAPLRQVLSQREKLERDLRKANLPEATITQMLAVYDAKNNE
jgi:hypothetical protein